MTTLLQVNRVLDSHTWEVLGERASERLVQACAASSDGAAFAHRTRDADGSLMWEFGHPSDYLNRAEVRIAEPMLTAKSTIRDLALLCAARGVRLTRFSVGDGCTTVRVERPDGTWSHGSANDAWRAINVALFHLESGRV